MKEEEEKMRSEELGLMEKSEGEEILIRVDRFIRVYVPTFVEKNVDGFAAIFFFLAET